MTIVGLINYKLQITIQIVGSNFVLIYSQKRIVPKFKTNCALKNTRTQKKRDISIPL